MSKYTKEMVARGIQHTNVNPDLSFEEVKKLCDDCVEYKFDGVMLQPCWVEFAKEYLAGTGIKVCTAIAYPMGGSITKSKVSEIVDCFKAGADQIDFMGNVGFLKSGQYDKFKDELVQIVDAAEGKVVKLMSEFGMLTEYEKKKSTELAVEAGVTYVKNSSGWGKGGHATVDDIKLIKSITGDSVGVKASGGIRTYNQAIEIFEAGADLIGTSSGVKILTGEGKAGDY